MIRTAWIRFAAVVTAPALVGSATAGVRISVNVQRQPAAPPVVAPIAPPIQGFVPAAPPSVEEFARGFRPVEGRYEVTLIHPKTCCPITVCFTLPCGCPKKVTANKHSLRFEYPGRDVVIRFHHNGSVTVRPA